MKAHIIHDERGRIKSIAFESGDVEGSLEISSDFTGDAVTTLDLDEALPRGATDTDLSSLAEKIRTGFRVDKDRRKLDKLRA